MRPRLSTIAICLLIGTSQVCQAAGPLELIRACFTFLGSNVDAPSFARVSDLKETDIEIDRELGAGGMGTVALGTARRGAPDELHVIVKEPNDHNSEAEASLRREYEVYKRYYPNDVALIERNGKPTLVMRVFPADLASPGDPAPDLTRFTRNPAAVTPELIRGVRRSVIAQLADMHKKGDRHNDIKPGNILIGQGGGRLIDFGEVTRAGEDSTAGTYQYYTPDRLRALAVADGASKKTTPADDTFALGLSLLELHIPRVLAARKENRQDVFDHPDYAEYGGLGPARFVRLKRIPDNRTDVSPETVMAHVTLLNKTPKELEQLLAVADEKPEDFRRAYGYRFAKDFAGANETRRADLASELVRAPILGPRLFSEISDAAVKKQLVRVMIEGYTATNTAAGRRGLNPFHGWQASSAGYFKPFLEAAKSDPAIRGDAELVRLIDNLPARD